MASVREFLVVIAGKESVSPAAGKADDSLGKLGDRAKKTERDFDTLDRKLREHANTIGHLRQEIAKTGDTKLFGELGRQEREFSKLTNLRKKLMDEGGPSATGFFAQFSGRLGPLVAKMPLSGPMMIALGTAAVAAAPFLGGVIAGALVGGAGIGGVVGGAILASKDARVKSAFSDLGDEIGADLRDAARPFIPAMLDAAKRVRTGFKPIGEDLKQIFATSSKFVAPLTDAALRFTKSVTGGLNELLAGAGGPAMQAIKDGLIGVGDALGDMFEMLADNGPEVALALSDLFDLIEGGVRVVGHLVNGLTELYGGLRLVTAMLNGDTDTLVRFIEAHRTSVGAIEPMVDALRQEETQAYDTRTAVELLTTALDRQVDGAIDAAQANLDYRQSLVDAKEAIDKKKGVSLEEEGALLRLAERTNTLTRKTDDNNESTATAKKRFDDARAAFIATAEKMGYTRQRAEELAEQMLKIPKKVASQIVLNEKAAKGAARNIQKAITDIHGKTVYVNVRYTGEYGEEGLGAMHGGVRASGGPVKAGMIYTVGEQGRETFVAPRDGYIINNRDTAMLAAGGGSMTAPTPAAGARPVVLQIAPGRFSGLERMFLSWLKEAIGNAGGNTLALGY